MSANISANWQRPAIAAGVLIAVTFGGMGGWAATAKLDSAVISPGVVGVESNRKVVQHLEGGIVRNIHVKEGDAVEEGQVLFSMDDTTPRASMETIRNQLDSLLVQEARLLAERDGADGFTLPPDLQSRAKETHLARIIADQQIQFRERKNSLEGQINLQQSRVDLFTREIEGLGQEKGAAEQQLVFIDKELEGMRTLSDKNLIQVTRLYAQERERARIEGIIGRATVDISKANNGISETRLQMRQLRQKFMEEVAANILEVRQKSLDLRERLRVAQDTLERTQVRAPWKGIVLGLRVFTPGQVVKAGEPLLEIVPSEEPLVINAQISPLNVDNVVTGMSAEVRFPSFHTRRIPVLEGKLVRVARDRMVDEASRQPYFAAQIRVDSHQIPEEFRTKLMPGMPAEVIFTTGERTVLNYIVNPLSDAMRKVLREE